MRFNCWRNRLALLSALVVGLCLGLQPVFSAEEIRSASDLAILIVGDEGDAEVLRKEKVLIQEIAKSLKKQNKVAIYSYHFNKERERTYCEKKLNVLREDLLFIGLVSLKDRVPRKVLYRIDRIASPARAAADILSRSEDALNSLTPGGEPSPGVTASPSPSPAPNPVGSPTPGPTIKTSENGKWRVQLGSFTQQKSAQDLIDLLRHRGYEAKLDKVTSESTTVFKVWVGTFSTREDANQTVTELQADGFEKGFVVEAK